MSASSTQMFTAAGRDSDDPAVFALSSRLIAWSVLAGFAAALSLSACSEPEDDPVIENGENGSVACVFDHGDSAEEAETIESGEEITGYLCPEGDEDWFRFEVPDQSRLVDIELDMGGPISPVDPTYVVRVDDDGSAGDVVATPPPLRVSAPHHDVFCLDQGAYFIVVRDRGGDSEDRRHEYTLAVSVEPHPDPSPRTEGPDDARPLFDGEAAEGFVACAGEVGWWSIEAPARRIARVTLTREPADWAPVFRVRSPEGELLMEASDPSGPVQATELERLVVLPEAGTYHVEVAAADGVSSDPSTSYSLTVDLIEDLDPNEPNDTPEEATSLSERVCGTGWSDEATATGTFGVPGDQDWFRLPLDGCERGVLEAVVSLDTSSLNDEEAWALQEELQSSITLVRPHYASPCESPSDCALLQQACNSEWDCAGYGNLCQGGRCSGALACLPEGVCGARMVQRSYQRAALPEDITGPPPPNEAVLSVPLYGDEEIYLNLSDWQSDAAAPELLYTLSVRVREDPDENEPSNLFVPDRERSDSIARQLDGARSRPGGLIDVHDCTVGDCCGPDTWVEGAISYELDEDFYVYNHPCPGEDCMLRIHYEKEEGPVDLLFSIFRGNRLWFNWFDGSTTDRDSLEDLPWQPAMSGVFGGDTAEDECFYAYQGHSDGPHYVISVRDLAVVRDWDPDQSYRFCIEKFANECLEPPCVYYDPEEYDHGYGCGTP